MESNIIYTLDKYNEVLTKEDLLHLLRRCLFGVGVKDLIVFENKTLDECLSILLNPKIDIPVPIQEDSDILDPLIPEGKTWVNAPYENDLIDNRRGLMLKMWWIGQLINRDHSLAEKMTLFWHNHFVTEMDIVKDSRYSYRYIHLLQTNALGNFKKLVRLGVENVAMLVYLNGNTNEKGNPNENFARELMELFTLGKDINSKYTEDDVRSAARVLSGWKDNKEKIEATFNPLLHDNQDKQFSSFFDNSVIKGRKGMDGAKEIDELIDIIFQKEETARFVCRNVYRWFVCANINEKTEQYIIQPLAKIFIANHFEIIPVLNSLLSSKHFFDIAFRACIVKNPVDFLIGAVRQFDLAYTGNLKENHIPWLQFYFYLGDLSMDIGNPPSVAGWMAYYQSPKFHRWWINSSSLGLRMKLLKGLCSEEGLIFNGPKIKFNFLHFIAQLDNPTDINELIKQSTQLLIPFTLNESVIHNLRLILLPEQEDELSWTEKWNTLSSNPDDIKNKEIVETRLRLFFQQLLALPEYPLT